MIRAGETGTLPAPSEACDMKDYDKFRRPFVTNPDLVAMFFLALTTEVAAQ